MDTQSQPAIEVVIDLPKLADNGTDVTNCQKTIGFYEHFVNITLLKFHAGYFRVSFSLCAQAFLWKTLIQLIKYNHYHHHQNHHNHVHGPTIFHNLPSVASTLLWSVALSILITFSLLYLLRCVYHFDKVKADFMHHVEVNYLFAPWMSCLLLLQTSPFVALTRDKIYTQVLFWVFLTPIIMLDIKIYGQWLTKGKRFLSRVANPTCQLSSIASLVAAKAAMDMEWLEVALCLFSLAMIHYLVLFITLYQRLPESNVVEASLRPVFFLFIATPSMASLAWASINGNYGDGSKMLFFLAIFLLMSLVSRPKLFHKSMKKFNIAWWAYSFPLTLLALASIAYAEEVKNGIADTLAFGLSIASILITLALMVLTTMKINKLFT